MNIIHVQQVVINNRLSLSVDYLKTGAQYLSLPCLDNHQFENRQGVEGATG